MDSIILVDIEDNQVGVAEKMEAHKACLLHRAFSVFLYSGDKILLQKRNPEKYHSGGLWANACCSHPRVNEALGESVSRRLKQELGISCQAEEIFSFVYSHKFSENLFEYEYDHVFLGNYDGPIDFAPDEISEVRWVSISELKNELIKNPEKFAVWFIIAAPKVIQAIESRL
jgi:isopentenyl-diphosphate delta-isomerase